MTMITTTTGRIHLRDYDDANIHQSRGGPPKPAPLPSVKTPRAMTAEYQDVLNLIRDRGTAHVHDIAAALQMTSKRATQVTRQLEACGKLRRAGLGGSGGKGRAPVLWMATK